MGHTADLLGTVMQKIPFYRPNIEQAEIDEVVATLKSGWLTTGPKARQFEEEFARYLGQKHAVAVNSCTAALHLALEAIGLHAGETVLVPTMTFAATAEVVRYFNAKPVLVDCRPEDFNLDCADAENKLTAALGRGERVRAILPVHYGGQVGDMAGVVDLASRYGLQIIEDAAHCCPALYRESDTAPWKSVGTDSAVSCYSFYANKTITTGEGGMACTHNAALAERMRIMALHGISKDAWKRFTAEGNWYYEIVAPGFKYNLTDVAAAMGIHQLRKADRLHQLRTQTAERYTAELSGIEELVLPQVQPNRIHSWHLYPVRLCLDRLTIDRAAFIEGLKQRGIGTSVHWMPLHMHPYYREQYGYHPEDLPVAAELYPQLVSLPLYPDLSEHDVNCVCEAIRELVARHLK
jgi:dTDP-4-amino-4,6-dideoxygalactose transaminase